MRNNLSMDGGTVFLIVISIIVVFLVLREVFCWYWKINRINASLNQLLEQTAQLNMTNNLLSDINVTLGKLLRQIEHNTPTPAPATRPSLFPKTSTPPTASRGATDSTTSS